MISITDGLQAIYNSNMREKTPLELERENRLLRQQINQLTNNWNELEDYLNEQIQRSWEIEEQCYETILDKMKEIEGNNND